MGKTVEYYLEKGFDIRVAEYFASGRRKILDVIPNDDFTIELCFDNGERRILDMKPQLLPGTIFEFMSDIDNFRRVYLDSDNCVCWDIDPNIDSELVWSNKINLDPANCYMNSKKQN